MKEYKPARIYLPSMVGLLIMVAIGVVGTASTMDVKALTAAIWPEAKVELAGGLVITLV